MTGEKEKALEQWKKSKESGKKGATLDKKIAEQQYFEAPEEELLNNTDTNETNGNL
jgi:hypothetical protein